MADDTTPRPARPRRWLSLLLIAGAFSFIGVQDGALGVLLPSLQGAYGLSKSGVSAVFFAVTAGYLLAATFTGPLVERLGLRLFLSAGGLAILLGLGLAAATPPWPALLAGLTVAGFGTAMLDAGLNAHVARLPDSAALLNYVHAIYGGGALAGPLLAAGLIGAGHAWALVYAVLAGLALLLAAGFAALFRAEGAAPALMGSPMAMGDPGLLRGTLGIPLVRGVALFMLLYLGAEVSIGSWTFSFLTEARGQTMDLAGWMISAYWVGLSAGRLLLGSLARRLDGFALVRRCLLGVAAGALALWLVPGPPATLLSLAWVGLCIGPIYPTAIATVARYLPARSLATAVGLLTSLGALGGALLPWLVGSLATFAGVAVVPLAVALLAAALAGLWSRAARSAGAPAEAAAPVQTCGRAVTSR